MDVDRANSSYDAARSPLSCLMVLAVAVGFLLASTGSALAQEPTARIEFLKYGSMATHVDQSPSGEQIAIGVRQASGGPGEVVLWNTTEQERVWSESFSTPSAPRVAFDTSGTQLAVSTSTGNVMVWNLTDGTSRQPQSTSAPVTDLTFGPGGTLAAAVGDGAGKTSNSGGVQVWSGGMQDTSASMQTDTSVRSMAFRPGTSELVFASNDTRLTIWNYRFNTTKTINTTRYCGGRVVDVALPNESPVIYFITKSYATCDPDHFCVLNAESRSLVDSFRRKNIRNIEPMQGGTFAYSRGNYVYTFNLRTGVEEVVYDSENDVKDLSYQNGTLVVANSDVILLEI